jgi:hypothetical protein
MISKINDDIQKKKKYKEGPKSTMEGGHMLNKLHTKSIMKQHDQGSKRYKRDALQCRAEPRQTNQMQPVYYRACQQQKNKDPMERCIAM